MNQLTTQGIVLRRTDFGEADRILTVLTPANGKLSLMARGARRSKSKLAGGIELFSTSDLVYIQGKSDLGGLFVFRVRGHRVRQAPFCKQERQHNAGNAANNGEDTRYRGPQI